MRNANVALLQLCSGDQVRDNRPRLNSRSNSSMPG